MSYCKSCFWHTSQSTGVTATGRQSFKADVLLFFIYERGPRTLSSGNCFELLSWISRLLLIWYFFFLGWKYTLLVDLMPVFLTVKYLLWCSTEGFFGAQIYHFYKWLSFSCQKMQKKKKDKNKMYVFGSRNALAKLLILSLSIEQYNTRGFGVVEQVTMTFWKLDALWKNTLFYVNIRNKIVTLHRKSCHKSHASRYGMCLSKIPHFSIIWKYKAYTFTFLKKKCQNLYFKW